MTRRCATCGDWFTPTRPYHARCWDCWRRHRDAEAGRDAYTAGFQAGTRAVAAAGTPALDPDLIRAAVALTHPDRHPPERAELATRITAQLIELLGRARSRAA